MNILGIIPARGGSKEVLKKNIKLLCGKPLIVWSIEEAKKSKHLTRLIVSTDDQEIADIAKKAGAEVPFLRPAEISGDLATDIEFLIHALEYFKKHEDYEPEIVLTLRATCPLKTAANIDEGIQTLINLPEADAARPIIESPKHPYKMWKIKEKTPYLESFLTKEFTGFDEPYNLPRQLFPKVYIHTGAMDIMRRNTILEQKSTSGKKLAYFYMKPEESVNIDHPIDFEFAEFLLQKRLGNLMRKDLNSNT